MKDLSAEELVVIATLIAILLAHDRSNAEADALGDLIQLVGATLSTIAATREWIESKAVKNTNDNK